MQSNRLQDLPIDSNFYSSLDSMLELFSNNENIHSHKFLGDLLGHTGSNKELAIYRKFNPTEFQYRLYADELVYVCKTFGAYSAPVAQYFMGLAQSGFDSSRMSLSQSASAYSRVFGVFNSAFIEAMSDGSISESERIALTSLIDDSLAKLQRLRSALNPILKVENV